MSACIIASYDVHNEPDYLTYIEGVVPLLQKHCAEILVEGPGAQALEGEARRINVDRRFESEEVAKKWYDDPEYGPVKQICLEELLQAVEERS